MPCGRRKRRLLQPSGELAAGVGGCPTRPTRAPWPSKNFAGHTVMYGQNVLLVGCLPGHRRYLSTVSYSDLTDDQFAAAAEPIGILIAGETDSCG